MCGIGCKVAGANERNLHAPCARRSAPPVSGIPRVINVACDRALLGAYTQETRKVTSALVRRAAGEVYGRTFVPIWTRWLIGTLCTAAVLFCAFMGWQLWQKQLAPLNTAAKAAQVAAPSAARVAAAPQKAAVPPTPAVPAPVPLNLLLAPNATNTSDAAAFRRLLSLWGTAMAEDKDPCVQAAKAGLACLEQRGSWAQVRALNRPAILTLTDERGERHRVVLSALDDQFATLDLGEHNERVALEDLSRDWFGDFTVVWKPKTLHTRLLSLGMQGDEVRWLRRSLNALRGGSSDPEHGDVYDQQLAIEVQNFQREHRLNVDGIAGLQTQVVLDTALAEPGSPLLRPTAARGG